MFPHAATSAPRATRSALRRGPAGRSARFGLVGALLLGTLPLAGCSTDGLRFVRDGRVEIVSPQPRSTVSIPMTVRWRSTLPADQQFALILGDGMVSPGRPVTDLVPADGQCSVTGDCRTAEALEAVGVYLTEGTSVTVTNLPALAPNQTSIEARLVLVDRSGRRDGESLWYVTLRAPRVEA